MALRAPTAHPPTGRDMDRGRAGKHGEMPRDAEGIRQIVMRLSSRYFEPQPRSPHPIRRPGATMPERSAKRVR